MASKKSGLDEAKRRIKGKIDDINVQLGTLHKFIDGLKEEGIKDAEALLQQKSKTKFFHKFPSVNQKLEEILSHLLLIKDAIYSAGENFTLSSGSEDSSDDGDTHSTKSYTTVTSVFTTTDTVHDDKKEEKNKENADSKNASLHNDHTVSQDAVAAVQQGRTSVSEHNEKTPEKIHIIPDSIRNISEEKSVVAESKRSVPDEKAAVPDSNRRLPAKKTATSENNKVALDEKTAFSGVKQFIPELKQSTRFTPAGKPLPLAEIDGKLDGQRLRDLMSASYAPSDSSENSTTCSLPARPPSAASKKTQRMSTSSPMSALIPRVLSDDVKIPPPTIQYDTPLPVLVTEKENPWSFYLQVHNGDCDQLMEELCLHFSREANQGYKGGITNIPNVGCYCCAKSPFDNTWYRAQVVEIKSVENDEASANNDACPSESVMSCYDDPLLNSIQATVFFVDEGTKADVPLRYLRPLEHRFSHLPAQAIYCKLGGVAPLNYKDGSASNWSHDSVDWFNQSIEQDTFFISFIHPSDDDSSCLPVDLYASQQVCKDTSHPPIDENLGYMMLLVNMASPFPQTESHLRSHYAEIDRFASLCKHAPITGWVFSEDLEQQEPPTEFDQVQTIPQIEAEESKEEKNTPAKPDKDSFKDAPSEEIDQSFIDKMSTEINNSGKFRGTRLKINSETPKEEKISSIGTKISPVEAVAPDVSAKEDNSSSKMAAASPAQEVASEPKERQKVKESLPRQDKQTKKEFRKNKEQEKSKADKKKTKVTVSKEEKGELKRPIKITQNATFENRYTEKTFQIGKEGFCSVIVSEVKDPSLFYVHLITPDVEMLDSMLSQLNDVYSKTELPVAEKRLNIGDAVVVKFSEDGNWYRGLIRHLRIPAKDEQSNRAQSTSSVSEFEYEILHVDFGSSEWVKHNDVRPVIYRFFMVPMETLPCCMADIEPMETSRDTSVSTSSTSSSNRVDSDAKKKASFMSKPNIKKRNSKKKEADVIEMAAGDEEFSDVFHKDRVQNRVGKWSEKTIQRFRDLILDGKQKVASLKDRTDQKRLPDEPWPVCLYDTNGDGDIFINQLLVDEGLAVSNVYTKSTEEKGGDEGIRKVVIKEEELEKMVDENKDAESPTSPLSPTSKLMNQWDPMKEAYLSDRNAYSINVDDPGVAITGNAEPSRRICKYFMSRGGCRQGRSCPYEHARPGDPSKMKHEAFCSILTHEQLSNLLPKPGDFILAQVTVIMTPLHFYVRFPLGPTPLGSILEKSAFTQEYDDRDLLCELVEKMNSMYAKMPYKDSEMIPFIEGELIATKFTNDDCWYRARVLEVLERAYKVFYIDYGNVETVKERQTRKLIPAFIPLEPQALEAFMSGVELNKEASEMEDFDKKAMECFEGMIGDGVVIARVMSVAINGTLYLELYDKKTSKNINSEMVKKKYFKEPTTVLDKPWDMSKAIAINPNKMFYIPA